MLLALTCLVLVIGCGFVTYLFFDVYYTWCFVCGLNLSLFIFDVLILVIGACF